ncbi:MAG: hypothetical protein H6513_04100 [Acidimicrobiaceae bacterium]|nr:hypothetical protein [Ilumatobacter sp.]MCB9379858.1 hypothetical protein [Acidimicrobiaceae bacterium]MCO5328908.1 hypothetical protein [Ilumatobacteraceae bacterium]
MTRRRLVTFAIAVVAGIVIGVPCLVAGAGVMALLPALLVGAVVFNDSEMLRVVAALPCVVLAALVADDAPVEALLVLVAAFAAAEVAAAGARVHKVGSLVVLPDVVAGLLRHGAVGLAALIVGLVATAGTPPTWLAVTALGMAVAGLVAAGVVLAVAGRRTR